MADMIACASEEDIARWQREKRDDILHVIESLKAVWAGDHFVSSRDGHYIHCCPFLAWDGSRHSCEIYPTRPLVCADFTPGSSEICPLASQRKK